MDVVQKSAARFDDSRTWLTQGKQNGDLTAAHRIGRAPANHQFVRRLFMFWSGS
jgi:hypothetical protein